MEHYLDGEIKAQVFIKHPQDLQKFITQESIQARMLLHTVINSKVKIRTKEQTKRVAKNAYPRFKTVNSSLPRICHLANQTLILTNTSIDPNRNVTFSPNLVLLLQRLCLVTCQLLFIRFGPLNQGLIPRQNQLLIIGLELYHIYVLDLVNA